MSARQESFRRPTRSGLVEARATYLATANVSRLDARALQRKTRHKAFSTTLGNISLANRMQEAAADVSVPDVLKAGGA